MLRYLLKIIDNDTGEILYQQQFRVKSEAQRFLDQQFSALTKMSILYGADFSGLVLDLLSIGLSKKIVYSRGT